MVPLPGASPEELRSMVADLHKTVQHLLRLTLEVRAKFDTIVSGPDAVLLAAAADAFGAHEFTTQELLLRASRPDEPGQRLAPHLQGMAARNVGVKLGRLAGSSTADGLTLKRVDSLRGYAIWRVFSAQD